MGRPARRSQGGRMLDGKYELRELVEYVGDRDHTSLWKGVVHGAAGFTRAVAIRKLPSTTAARQAALRGAALAHGNVVRVYDVVRDEDGNLYLVMEWIDGVALDELARGARQLGLRVPWPLVGAIGVGALHGLAAGHGQLDGGAPAPIIHGHLSARSVLLDTRGAVRLTPFGLADGTPGLTGRPPSKSGDLRDLAAALAETLAGGAGPEAGPPLPPRLRAALALALDEGAGSADELAREIATALNTVPWRRGPLADLGDVVVEVMAALAWNPGEVGAIVPAEPGAPELVVHLAPPALAAARSGAFARGGDRDDDDTPYAAYELATR